MVKLLRLQDTRWQDGEWVNLDSVVDPVTNTVTARVSHFTAFAVLPYVRPAAFTLTDLFITPEEVDIGETVTISVLVTNIGNLTGNYTVTLKIDTVVVDTKDVTLGGGASETVTFTTTKDVAGTYTVNVNGLLGTFIVKAPPPPPPPPPPLRQLPRHCFIATAAYGTPMAMEIQILRDFRDQYLLTNALGRAFVDFYYRVSPPIAQFIADHPVLKPIVRAGLMPAIAVSTVAIDTTPAEKAAIIGLLVLVSTVLAVWATRRRGRGPEYT